MEVFDEFASQLGLKPLEKRRLEKAMNGAIERYGGVTEDAKASVASGVDVNQNAEMALTKAPTTETEKEAPKETAEAPTTETEKEAPKETAEEAAPEESTRHSRELSFISLSTFQLGTFYKQYL
eukprot:symbB.v1.2.032029.t1/scaffold3788.1/size50346/2